MRDNYCMPITRNIRHISTMTIPPKKQTADHATSSADLIKYMHKRVGPEVLVTTKSTGTETNRIECKSQQTSSEGLILYSDSKAGPDESITFQDAAVATNSPSTKDVATDCQLPLKASTKALADKNTMTSLQIGKWIFYADMVTVACGDESDKTLKTISTNTESFSVVHKGTETTPKRVSDQTAQANLRLPSSNVSTNTSAVLKYNRSTDCSEIQPVLRHNASNTVAPKTSTSSTQYAMNRSNLVDCMVNTDNVKTSNAETTTDDLEVSKNIDVYVDKVECFATLNVISY